MIILLMYMQWVSMAIGKDPAATQFLKRLVTGSRLFQKVNGVKVMLENVVMLCLQEKGKRVPALIKWPSTLTSLKVLKHIDHVRYLQPLK